MPIQRNIQHPGVEIREIDKSQYTPAIEGTYCLLAGYADKGEESNPIIVSDAQSFTSIYGEPTNEAERYFYYAGQEILRTGGTLIAAKLPYDNLISNHYKAIGINITDGNPISGFTAATPPNTGFTTVTSEQLSAVGYTDYATVDMSNPLNMPTTDYDVLLAGMTSSGASFPTTASTYDFLIVDKSKQTIQGTDENEGILIAIVDPIDALNVQRVLSGAADTDSMDLLSGFTTSDGRTYIDGNDMSVNLIDKFSNSSVSEDIMRQFPTIEFFDGGASINREYSHHIGVIVCQVFTSNQDEGKFKIGILEAFVGSIHNDARDKSTSQSIYIADLINAGSRYIQMFYNNSNGSLPVWQNEVQDNDTILYKSSSTYPLIGFDKDETEKKIKGGEIKSELQKIYEKVSNIDEIQIDLVIDGGLSTIAQFTDDAGGTLYEPIIDVDPDDVTITQPSDLATWRDIVSEMIIFCRDARKDCMTILDVPRHLVIEANSKYIRPTVPDNTFSNTIGQKLKYVTGLNSSYAALYANWFKMVDGFTGNNFWIPQSVKMAGIYIYNDRIANIWDAPAGLNRGIIYGVNDLAFNPNDKDADQIYIKSINYAKRYPLDGFIAEGQKTTQVKPSAFDRVNVRRLFLRLERLAYQVSRYFVYEPNNFFTRRRLVDMLDPIFSRVKQQGGLYDYLIVCDERNNTPDVIDRNELKVAIYLKPVKTVEFILIDFIATRTGGDFSEILDETL